MTQNTKFGLLGSGCLCLSITSALLTANLTKKAIKACKDDYKILLESDISIMTSGLVIGSFIALGTYETIESAILAVKCFSSIK